MINIINAVKCTEDNTIVNIATKYLNNNKDLKVYVDNERIKDLIEEHNGKGRCYYNNSIVALWLKINSDSLIIITDIVNEVSEIYNDLNKNYNITCIESTELGCDVDGRKG